MFACGCQVVRKIRSRPQISNTTLAGVLQRNRTLGAGAAADASSGGAPATGRCQAEAGPHRQGERVHISSILFYNVMFVQVLI